LGAVGAFCFSILAVPAAFETAPTALKDKKK
jgi:hypothetical protein